MTELSLDLKNMLNETCKLRKTFLELKTENIALFRLSEKLKQQLNKSRNRCKKLMKLFTEKYRCTMKISAGLRSEIRHLRQIVSDLQPEIESQAVELKCKNDLFTELEEELEILRSQIDLQADEHKKNIETIQERNRIEKNRIVSQYQTKLDAANSEIKRLKERLDQQIEHQNKSRQRFSHPALSDSESSTNKEKHSVKRRKKQDSRWPNLNITTSAKEEESPKTNKTPEQSTRRKKLFLVDNENIVDLET